MEKYIKELPDKYKEKDMTKVFIRLLVVNARGRILGSQASAMQKMESHLRIDVSETN